MPDAKKAKRRAKKVAPKTLKQRLLHPAVWGGMVLASLIGGGVWMGSGCGSWDYAEPLMRNAPEVDEAIRLMDAGKLDSAAAVLQSYLGTAECQDGELGVPASARNKPDGTFDLGLVLFGIAETFGGRFGDEEAAADGVAAPSAEPPEIDERRTKQIACALAVVNAIAGDAAVSADLRARAYYLAGNLEFLQREYQKAVDAYDLALQLVPGIPVDASGDQLGIDAAWNRAIALRRLQDDPDASDDDDQEPDASPDGEPDGGEDGDQGDDAGDDQQSDPQNGNGGGDSADAGGGGNDQGADAGADAGDDQAKDDDQDGDKDDDDQDGDPKDDMGSMAEAGEAEAEQSRMSSILDELADAPTYQQEAAKREQGRNRRRVLEDK